MFEIFIGSIIACIGGGIGFYLLYLKPYPSKETPMPNTIPATPQIPDPDALLPWDTKENCRHNVRAIADLEGLTVNQKDDLSSTVHCESNYNPQCVHPNIVNGKTASTDYGIAQINDFWHIGTGKDFPSVEYVLQNPEACIRWMARAFKNGNAGMWVCHLKKMNLDYTP